MHGKKNNTLKYAFLLLIVIVPLFSLGVSNHGLWSADEPRVAEIGREMALSNNWAVPTLNQKPFLEEPPLYYASLAIVFKVFGISDRVARIPSAFFAFATVLVVFFMANRLFGPRIAFFSGLILATTGEFIRVAHWVIVDGALTFFVASALFLFITAYLSETDRKKLLRYGLFYVACTLAFYTKGFIGIVIPVLGILAFLVIEKNLKEIVRMRLWLGLLIFLAMTLPWFFTLWHQAGTEYLNVFFVHNHLQRFFPAAFAAKLSDAASGHHHPFYYYLTEFPNGFLPWSIFLIPVLLYTFSKSHKTDKTGMLSQKGTLLAKCWFLAGIIFLSVASTKRTLYLMPIFAPIAMLTALYIDHTIAGVEDSRWLRRIGTIFMWVFDLVFLIIGLGLTPVYVYLKENYLFNTPHGFMAWIVMLSTLLVIVSLTGMWYRLHGNMKRYWFFPGLSIVFPLVFSLAILAPVLDKHKSFVPFCRAVANAVPPSAPLYGYVPDETLQGALPFYTGYKVIDTGSIQQVASLIKSDEPFFIMVRDKREEAEKELLATGKLSILVKQIMGTDRTLVLLSNAPVETALVIGEPFRKIEKAGTARRIAPEKNRSHL